MSQTVPVEIIVMDDGSTDETGAMVAAEFPTVRYERSEGGRGPCVMRNRGITLATAPIVFPIDDDAVFVSTHTVAQTLAEFDHPRVGAVGIPFANVRTSLEVQQQAPQPQGVYVCHAYVGAAHALRRDLFVELGGYREDWFYMGEEGDYCLRMLNRGFVVRLGRADPMHHFESPSRVAARAIHYGRRNDVLFNWLNVPMPEALIRAVGTSVLGFRHGCRVRRPFITLRGIFTGWAASLCQLTRRRPVSRPVFQAFRKLKLARCLPLSEIEAALPPINASVK